MKPENLRLPKRGDEWHLLFTRKKGTRVAVGGRITALSHLSSRIGAKSDIHSHL